MKTYDKKIDDEVLATYKIDGVKGICKDGLWTSRANKPLYNLPKMPDGEYEIFLGNFKDSISACRTHEGSMISKEYLYRLDPPTDPRLVIGYVLHESVELTFKKALLLGYEGLVLKTSKGQFKLKDKITLDVDVVAIIEGTGKYRGMMGALQVEYKGNVFKVGTGFTDSERQALYTDEIVGKILEIEGMELLSSGRLRHPRFVRIREDLK